jgi:hypothetical protein
MEVHFGKIDLWQGCHEMDEEISKIVPLGAPLSSPFAFNSFQR